MKLLMFEHCSLCFRVRMVAALKGIHLAEQVVEDDDSAAMTALWGAGLSRSSSSMTASRCSKAGTWSTT
jgi:glutaredoxin 2